MDRRGWSQDQLMLLEIWNLDVFDHRHTPEVPFEIRQVAGKENRKRKGAHYARDHGLKHGHGNQRTLVEPKCTGKCVRKSGRPVTKHFLE